MHDQKCNAVSPMECFEAVESAADLSANFSSHVRCIAFCSRVLALHLCICAGCVTGNFSVDPARQ